MHSSDERFTSYVDLNRLEELGFPEVVARNQTVIDQLWPQRYAVADHLTAGQVSPFTLDGELAALLWWEGPIATTPEMPPRQNH